MNLLTHTFKNSALRIVDQSGAPWFCSTDVCAILGLTNPRQSVKSLDADEKITVTNDDGNPRAGVPHQLTYVSEPGLFRLISKSRKPDAKAFQRWVFHEVLPQIRKTGSFIGKIPTRTELAQMVIEQDEQLEIAKDVIRETLPKHEYGSVAKSGKLRTGFRRAAYVAARSKLKEAALVFGLCQADLFLEGAR